MDQITTGKIGDNKVSRFGDKPSMDDRERASGLSGTMSGRSGEDDDLFPSKTPLSGQGNPVRLTTDADGVDSWEPPRHEEQQPYGGNGGTGGTLSEEDLPTMDLTHPYKLTGTFTYDISGNPTNILYSVASGNYKRKGQSGSQSYGGVTNQAYINPPPTRPHFYLAIPVDETSMDAEAGAVVFQSSELVGTPVVRTAQGGLGGETVIVYIGSFTGTGSAGKVTVSQGQTEDIEYDLNAQDGGIYAFKVVDNGDGSVSVLSGSVDTVDVAQYDPAGQPTGIWLRITTDADTGNATAAAHQLSNPGAFTTTMCHVKVATITWASNVPTIIPGVRGNITVAGCGATYEIKSLG